MNKVIYKYVAEPDSPLELPKGAQILDVATQQGMPCVWALVDPEAEKEMRRIHLFATGEWFDPTGLTYIGTFHQVTGWMVFHLFEEVSVTTK